MPCILCDDVHAAGDVVFENETGLVLLHPDSAVAGHAMVVSRRHVENLADLAPHESRAFAAVQHAAERALLDETGAGRAILLKLGIQVPHLHVHIYPVSNTMTRAEVMRVIDGEVREVRTTGFAGAVRARIERLTSPS
jgi:diadenosine tetraphosphate (Ap4A) HIT family hydrolase